MCNLDETVGLLVEAIESNNVVDCFANQLLSELTPEQQKSGRIWNYEIEARELAVKIWLYCKN